MVVVETIVVAERASFEGSRCWYVFFFILFIGSFGFYSLLYMF